MSKKINTTSNKMEQMNGKNPHLMKKFLIFSIILFLAVLSIGAVVFMVSMRNLVSANEGRELTKRMEIKRVKLEAFVNRELAIVLKMADSPMIRRYFLDPGNKEKEACAIEEIEGYRRAFGSLLVFWINDIDKIFSFTGSDPYVVDPDNPVNYWYNRTLYETELYNFNINYSPELEMINLWINAPVFDDNGKPIGLVGSGIELNNYIDALYADISDTEILFMFNAAGEITGARDTGLMESKKHITEELPNIGLDILQEAASLNPDETKVFNTPLGKVAIGSLSILDWYTIVITPIGINDYDPAMIVLFLVMIAVLGIVLMIFNAFISIFLKSLDKTMEALKEASNAKSKFLATISHEIRTPLNAIIGIAQIQIQKDNLPKEDMTVFSKIYNSGNTLLGIINDILDMSKIEMGKMEINPVEYDVPSLINDTVQLNIVRIGSKHIELELAVDENLPSKLYGDELRLKQILNNLLSNAIKYTEKGHVKVSIDHFAHHFAQDADVTLRFIVEDTGQGIRSEDQSKLFSEFLRFNAQSNRATEGTGIGLSITKKLVELMNGTISVESEYGKGSKFTVLVKQKSAGCATIGSELAQKLCNFSFTREQTRLQVACEIMPYGSVLIVDDVDTNLYVAEGLLSRYKLKIDTAISGFAAIEKIESGAVYDVIFMDHMMPLMDGIETTQKLRKKGYKGAIVALTANALIGNEEIFMQNGFDGFVAKPIDLRHLNAVLNKFVRDRSLQRSFQHPEEAIKYKPELAWVAQSATTDNNLKFIKVFCDDAQKVCVTLRETLNNGDYKLFATTAHSMRAALKHISEEETAELAFSLEKAAQNGDKDFIAANMENYIGRLSAIAEKLLSQSAPEEAVNNGVVEEDTSFLLEQLFIIKTACENYDGSAVYTALNLLKEKQWKTETSTALENIHDTLFLEGDFEKAIEKIQNLLDILNERRGK